MQHSGDVLYLLCSLGSQLGTLKWLEAEIF